MDLEIKFGNHGTIINSGGPVVLTPNCSLKKNIPLSRRIIVAEKGG